MECRERSNSKNGFTIVELLVVIVVIAVLASISVVTYNGIKDRAVASQRMTDMKTIAKALEMYKVQEGVYPFKKNNSFGGWERSSVNPQLFLDDLVNKGIITQVPVPPDDLNISPADPYTNRTEFVGYAYMLYEAGQFGCDPAAGRIYVLKIEHDGKPLMDQSPGISCPGNPTQPILKANEIYLTGRSVK